MVIHTIDLIFSRTQPILTDLLIWYEHDADIFLGVS